MTEEKTEEMTEEMEMEQKATDILVGVRQNEMIINGIVYCDSCWCTRPDDKTLCPCHKDEVRTCEDCSNTKDPCAFCQPIHHANHKIAMAELEKILASLEEQSPPPTCSTCNDKGTECMRCGHQENRQEEDYQKHYWSEDDPDYREHKYEY